MSNLQAGQEVQRPQNVDTGQSWQPLSAATADNSWEPSPNPSAAFNSLTALAGHLHDQGQQQRGIFSSKAQHGEGAGMCPSPVTLGMSKFSALSATIIFGPDPPLSPCCFLRFTSAIDSLPWVFTQEAWRHGAR